MATFFRAFSLKPRGKHICTVCLGTACHVRGAPKLVEKLERDLQVQAGETTADMNITLETVNCVGACALGPLVILDGEYHGNISSAKLDKVMAKVTGRAEK
jgi:NADH-quinone oxidoreductase subunit E